MEIKPGYVYFLSEDYFRLINDPKLMRNKGKSHYRPFYCCKREEGSDIYWLIPLSSQIVKFRAQFSRTVSKYGSCLSIALGRFGGRDAAFLIQNACPATPQYITNVFEANGNPVPVHSHLQKLIYSKFMRSMAIQKRGHRMFYTNISENLEIIQQTTQNKKTSLGDIISIAERKKQKIGKHKNHCNNLRIERQI